MFRRFTEVIKLRNEACASWFLINVEKREPEYCAPLIKTVGYFFDLSLSLSSFLFCNVRSVRNVGAVKFLPFVNELFTRCIGKILLRIPNRFHGIVWPRAEIQRLPDTTLVDRKYRSIPWKFDGNWVDSVHSLFFEEWKIEKSETIVE